MKYILGLLLLASTAHAGQTLRQQDFSSSKTTVTARGGIFTATVSAAGFVGSGAGLTNLPSSGVCKLGGGSLSVLCLGLGNLTAGTHAGVLSGQGNSAGVLDSGIVSGNGNSTSGGQEHFIGAGLSNAISNGIRSGIGSGGGNTIASAGDSFIGAGNGNTMSGGSQNGILAGSGNNNGVTNGAMGGGSGNVSTSGGNSFNGAGQSNQLIGSDSFNGAGQSNIVSGDSAGNVAGNNNTVSGVEAGNMGTSNTASGPLSFTIGNSNIANNTGSVCLGGESAMSLGSFSTTIGGNANEAHGFDSLAAGTQCKATADGSFCMSDSQLSDYVNSSSDSWAVRFQGGMIFETPVATFTHKVVASSFDAVASDYQIDHVSFIGPDRVLYVSGAKVNNIDVLTATSPIPSSSLDSSSATLQGNIVNAANRLVRLNNSVQLPPVDGSQLVNVFNATAAVKTKSENVNASTAYQNDDELFISLLANTTYEIEAVIIATATSGTPDLKFGFNAVAQSTMTLTWTASEASGAFAAGTIYFADDGDNIAIAGSGVIAFVWVKGIIVTSSAGTLNFRWAQNISDATSTNVLKNSYLKARRL